MALRRLLKLIAGLGLLIGALALVGGFVYVQSGRARTTLRNVLAQELARSLKREVQVGTVSGNLLTGVRVDRVAIAGPHGLAQGVDLVAEQVSVEWDLPSVLRGKLKAPAAIRRLVVERVYARVDLGEEDLAKLLRPKPVKRVPPEERFQPVLEVKQGLVDLLIPAGKRQLAFRLTEVNGQARFNAVGPAHISLTARSGDGSFGDLALRALSDGQEGFLSIRGEVNGLSLERLGGLLSPSGPRVASGTASGQFQFWQAPGSEQAVGPLWSLLAEGETPPKLKREVGFRADLIAANVNVALPASSGGPVTIHQARLLLTPQGAELRSLDVAYGGLPLRLTGWVYDFAHPSADVALALSDVDLALLWPRLPASVRAQLPFSAGGRASVTVAAVGPVSNLNASIALTMASGGRLLLQAGEVTVGALAAEAQMWDSAAPAVQASFTATGTRPGFDLLASTTAAGPAPTGGRPPPSLKVDQLGGLRGTVLLASKTGALLEGSLTEATGSYEASPFQVRSTRFAWAGRFVRLTDLYAEFAGGQAALRAFVELPARTGDPPVVTVRGTLEQVDLARLPDSLWGPTQPRPSGVFSGTFGGRWAGNAAHLGLQFALRGGTWGGQQIDEANGLAWLDFQGGRLIRLESPRLALRSPAGDLWAHGTYLPDGSLDLVAELNGMDLAQVPGLKPEDNPAGRAYGTVHLTGTTQQPEITAELVVFGARYQEYEASAVLVKLREHPRLQGTDNLAAAITFPLDGELESYASYDTAVAHLQVAMTPPPTEADAPGLSGELKVTGLRLPALARYLPADWSREHPLEGLAEVQLTLGGTTVEPHAEGDITLANARWGEYLVDSLRAPLYWGTDPEGLFYLAVQQGAATVQGADLRFDARVNDVFSAGRTFTVEGRGTGIKLERLAFLRQLGLPLGGDVLLPRLSLQGSSEGVTGEVQVLSDQVLVDRVPVTGLDAHVVVDGGQVRLERTSMEVAGGHVGAELTYERQDGTVAGEVSVTGAELPRLLRLVAPLAAAASPPAERERVRRQWDSWSVRAGGTLTARAQLSGPLSSLVAQTTVNLQGPYLDQRSLPDLQGSLLANVAERSVRNVDLEMQMGEAGVTISGDAQSGGQVNLVAEASNVDLALLRDWLPSGLSLGGVVGNLSVVAQGDSRSPVIRAGGDVHYVTLQGMSFDLLAVNVVRIAEGGIDLEDFLLKRDEREIRGHGHLPFSWSPLGVPLDQPVNFSAKLAKTDLSFFPPLLDEFLSRGRPATTPEGPPGLRWASLDTKGSVDAELDVAGTLRQPSLSGYVNLVDGALKRKSWAHPLEDLQARVALSSAGGVNQVTVAAAGGRWDQTTFGLSGDVQAVSFAPDRLGENHYNLAFTLDSPQETPWPGLVADNLQGKITFATQPDGRQLLQVEKLSAQLGEGSADLQGGVQVTHFRLADFARNLFDLKLALAQAQVGYGDAFHGTLQGNLTIANPQPDAPALIQGDLVIPQGALGLPEGTTAPATWHALGPGFPAFGLQVRATSGANLWLRTPGVQAPLLPGQELLRLSGTLQAPHLSGGGELDAERASVMSSNFVLSAGGLTYTLAPAADAGPPPVPLVLAARYWAQASQTIPSATVEGRNIGLVHLALSITGEVPGSTNVSLTSEPPLTEDQKLTLMGLEPFTGTGTTDVSQMLSQRFMSLLAIGVRQALLAPLEQELRRSLGLTEFTVAFSLDQPMELRVGKLLFKNFLISYRYSLVNSQQELWNLGLSYEWRSMLVTFSTNESGDEQFRVSRTWSF